MRWVLGLAMVAALAGCAPGDIELSKDEVVARGRQVELRTTLTRRVFEVEQGRPFRAHCLEGWAFTDGRADVVAVTGNRFTPRDFLVSAESTDGSTGILARVRHVGGVVPDPGIDRGTYVTVEFRLTCTDPTVK